MTELRQVFVYWNFHDRLFTLQDPVTQNILRHVPEVTLRNAQCVIDTAERERSRRLRRRTFHAGIRGEIVEEACFEGTELMYDVMAYDFFVTVEGRKPVEGAGRVRFEVDQGKPRMFAEDLIYISGGTDLT